MGAAGSVAVAALCASTAEVLLGFPLDTVKTRLQAQGSDAGVGAGPPASKARGGSSRFRSAYHCALVSALAPPPAPANPLRARQKGYQ